MDAANLPQSVVDEPSTGFLCTNCRQRIADKTDSNGNPICEHCLLGLFTVRYVGNRIARNDKCPCGSGKKFKYCHRRDTGVLTCQ